jgi:hypothetical protein
MYENYCQNKCSSDQDLNPAPVIIRSGNANHLTVTLTDRAFYGHCTGSLFYLTVMICHIPPIFRRAFGPLALYGLR